MKVYHYIHVALFVGGALLLFAALVVPSDALLAGSGIGFAASGALSLFGIRVALQGPLGNLLRGVLEARPLMKMRLGAVLWVALGIYLAVWGLSRLSEPAHPSAPESPPPSHAASA
jgi:hypothetical protein